MTRFTDDLDGSTLAEGEGESVGFALDGQSYENSLSPINAAMMRRSIQLYIERSRQVSSRRWSPAARLGNLADMSRRWGGAGVERGLQLVGLVSPGAAGGAQRVTDGAGPGGGAEVVGADDPSPEQLTLQ